VERANISGLTETPGKIHHARNQVPVTVRASREMARRIAVDGETRLRILVIPGPRNKATDTITKNLRNKVTAAQNNDLILRAASNIPRISGKRETIASTPGLNLAGTQPKAPRRSERTE